MMELSLKNLLSAAIALGYEQGCSDTEGGTQTSAEDAGERALPQLLEQYQLQLDVESSEGVAETAKKWVDSNVVLAEHCEIEYRDLYKSLAVLLEGHVQTVINPESQERNQ